jgi:1-acyl-sn-glycerol-3-phosphate acyltransferase
MTSKPWHYDDCRHGDIFWKYAEDTSVYGEIKEVLAAYTDQQKAADAVSGEKLVALAIEETNREDNYQRRLNKILRAKDRVEILEKIAEYERKGIFDLDVEDDPPGKVLMPDDIEYLKEGPAEKVKTEMAFQAARLFVKDLMKEKKLIVKEIKGIENLRDLQSGAVITCNHFNAFDSFAIQMAYDAAKQPKRKFYRVIREGNYTSFTGFYGMLMRNCNTLPLSSNYKTMQKFLVAVDKVLTDGHFLLVYPEQSMWWNYRKPKPLKAGAFQFAAKNNVPVLPCFITMKDTDILGEDGFFVQEYTVHVSPPIYPDESLGRRERASQMMAKNAEIWKNIYETEYSMPLTYTTEKE